MKILFDCHWNESLWQRLRFMTVAKVILHGAFLARVSVCASRRCVHPAPGNASPAYLASTRSRRPRSLGASEKAAKAPAESRGKPPVEGAAAAPKSDGSSVAGSGSKSRSLPPAFQPRPPLSNSSSWCDAAQWVHCSSQQRRRKSEGRR